MRHISECDLSTEQVREDTSSKVTSATSHSEEEMGKYIHGHHYRPTQGLG
jgi:hypothetical protein